MGEAVSDGHHRYQIAGHTVWFPCKPYPSQFSMMDKILRGLERRQNCLLESPTGSGKSLALLCSALAWQAAEKEKPEACQCRCHAPKPATPAVTMVTSTATVAAPAVVSAAKRGGAVSKSSADVCGETRTDQQESMHKSSASDVIVIDEDPDEDFRPLKKFREPSKSSVLTKKKARLSIEYEDTPPSSPCPHPSPDRDSAAGQCMEMPPTPHTEVSANSRDVSHAGDPVSTSSPCSHCSCGGGPHRGGARKIPKIFFGTRTHKQITQIVRELGKTKYHDVSMTILASREHTCIHPQVSHSANKNEGCEQLLKDAGCSYKDRVMRYQSQRAITDLGLCSAWDLEDLVQRLKKKKVCPYFVSRGLKDQVDLVLCPYNYLVDPLIRNSMEISLKGQVVLLDEAHNMEDAVREAASQTITQDNVLKALDDMDALIEKGIKVADISKLRQICHRLNSFIEERSSSLTTHDFDQHYSIWSGMDIVAQLQQQGLGPQDAEWAKVAVVAIKAAEQEERQYASDQDVPALSSATWSLLEQLFLVLRYLYQGDMKYADDYRMSLVKTFQYVSVSPSGSWLSSRRHQGKKKSVEVFALNFWCMNPAVGFEDFASCRSVILTSGTLSPMESFQSELDQPFPISMEASHVIADSQVWVGAVGRGMDGSSLKAVFQNLTSFHFQDSLGHLILQVCSKVPKGVLCFLPSYNALEKLTARWKQTGLWDKLREHKHVMYEPRRSDSADFEENIRAYYRIIKHGDDGERGGVDGALFFAVCRGKVSEGLDFADDFARAVITVGIPYPNFKDIQVQLKKEYNDKARATRRLLTGSQWYEIQAFRALNQALGRCIRHRNDWGALIIVDDRFVQNTNKYSHRLSKWVRQKLRVYPSCTSMLSSLSAFVTSRRDTAQFNDSFKSSHLLPSTPQSPASSHISPPPILSPPPLSSSPQVPPTAGQRGRHHDMSRVTSPPAQTSDISRAVATTVPSTERSPPPPLPYIPMAAENRSPLHDVSNVNIPQMGLTVAHSSPSTLTGVSRVTMNMTDAVTPTVSDVAVVTSCAVTVSEENDVTEPCAVSVTMPETPSPDANGVSEGSTNAVADTHTLLPVVTFPLQNQPRPPSPTPNPIPSSVQTEDNRRMVSKIGISTGEEPAVSASSSRSVVQEQRGKLVSGAKSRGRGVQDVRCDRLPTRGVTVVAGHSERRGDASSASTGCVAATSLSVSPTYTAGGHCHGQASTVPSASVTCQTGLDLGPGSDPPHQLNTVAAIGGSLESLTASSPSLFVDSPNFSSPALRATVMGRSASPSEDGSTSVTWSDRLKTESSASTSTRSASVSSATHISAAGKSRSETVASANVVRSSSSDRHPPHPSPPPRASPTSAQQDSRLQSPVHRGMAGTKKPLFRYTVKKGAGVHPSLRQATVDMFCKMADSDVKVTGGGDVSRVVKSDPDEDGSSSAKVKSDADGDAAAVDEGEEKLVRRVRTTKRRSLSLAGGSKKRRSAVE